MRYAVVIVRFAGDGGPGMVSESLTQARQDVDGRDKPGHDV